MKALAARRRHPVALLLLLMMGLLTMGAGYAALAPRPASAASALSADAVEEGNKLFQANCATCHGLHAEGTAAGPSLIGVGAAAADFQIMTGRMPMAANAVQVMRNDPPQLSQEQSDAIGAFISSLGGGPGKPAEEWLDTNAAGVSLARGGEIFRVNCSMCHNYAGAGGALTRGKEAPSLRGVSEQHMYEAMISGPQSMPVFNDTNLDPAAKRDVIAFLKNIDKNVNPGGHNLGNFGPVGDGYFLWLLAMPLMIGAAVWLGRKAA